MKTYFSCSITGGRKDEAVYAALVAHLEARGHPVLNVHLASPQALEDDTGLQAEAVAIRTQRRPCRGWTNS